MRYEIEIRKRAEKDFASIPKSDAQHIADAIFVMEGGLVGNIKKLANFSSEYRLRVRDWRILFEVSKNKIDGLVKSLFCHPEPFAVMLSEAKHLLSCGSGQAP